MSTIKDHFEQADFDNLLEDAKFFADRTQDCNFVEDVVKRYQILGMEAGLTEKQAQQLKDIGGWA